MSYVVLARKWRPKQFDEVVGQEHVARTLKNAIEQDRVAHAFLFTGARGVGKTSTARILAKALNCQAQDSPTPTPCDACDSCQQITSGHFVDVFEIDGASNRGINEIRELRESVRYAPSRGRIKIYIIDEVHMLTTEAFNALLKTLEEPPPHVKFVFATTEPQKIPVTILSRCQRFDFKRIGQNDIVRHLELLCDAEGIKAEKAALQIVARQASGGMRDALSLLDQIISFAGNEISEASVLEILGVANRSHLFNLSEAILQRSPEGCLLTLDEVHRFGYDLQQFATEFVTHLRDLMVLAVVKDPERVTNLTTTEIAQAREQIQDVPVDLLHRYFSLAVQNVPDMARSQFPKLIFEMMLVRMSQLEPLVGLDLLVDRLVALESEIDSPTTIERSEPSAPREVRSAPRVTPTPNPAPVPDPEPVPETRIADVVPPDHAIEEQIEAAPEVEPESETLPTLEPVAPDVPEAPTSQHPEDIPEIGRLNPAEIAALSPYQRWERVVAEIRPFNGPLAATCEYGYPEKFSDKIAEISFPDKYIGFISEGHRPDILKKVIHSMFGADWKVDLQLQTEEVGEEKLSIAQERDAKRARLRAQLEEEVRSNPVVDQAKKLFDVAEDAIKVQVKLFDDI